MNFVDPLLSWIVAATVRGSLLIAAVVLLQMLLRPWMPAQWRFALWLPAVIALGMPLLPECRLSLEDHFSSTQGISERCCPSFDLSCATGVAAALRSEVSQQAATGWRIIVGCWLLGAAWVFGVVVWSYACTLRRLRHGALPASPVIEHLVREAVLATGLNRAPKLLVSAQATGPAVTGALRPTLLLPPSFPGSLTDEEALLVLQHELLHIRRHDLLVNWLLCLLQALHWFNPVAWLAFGKIRSDREEACDEQVLKNAAADCRAAYGHALIKMGMTVSAVGSHMSILRLGSSAASLRRRIRIVAGFQRPRRTWTLAWLSLIAALTVLGATRSPNSLQGAISIDGAGREIAMDSARTTILPKIRLADVTVAEAVDYLERQVRLANPDQEGFRIWLTPEGAKSARQTRVSVSLDNASVWQALVNITGQAGLGLDGNSGVVCLKWPFATRDWVLDSTSLHTLGLTPNEECRAALSARGLNLPAGASAHLVPLAGTEEPPSYRLLIQSSQEDLQRVDALLKTSAPVSR